MSENERSATENEAAEESPSVFRALVSSLWFPAFFVIGFMVCYLLPFHAPAPHDVPVAVVGEPAATAMAESVAEESPGAFDVTAVESPDAARAAVEERDVVASYDPGSHELYTAGANGKALQQVLLPAFSQGGAAPTVVDVAPTAPGDAMGNALFYMIITMNLVGYISVMMLLRAELSTRTKLAALAGMGAFASVVSYLVALSLDVITNHLGLLLIGFVLTQAVAWVTYGLVPLVKQFIPGVAMGLFVMLSIPSSGGAIPKEMVPGFFQTLHPIMPMGNAVEAMRGLLYFDGAGTARGVVVLVAWLVLGAALIGIDAFRRRRTAGAAESEQQEEHDDSEGVVDPVLAAPDSVRAHDALAGSIVDRDGGRVDGVIVTVTDAAGNQLARVHTGADGQYAVRELPEQHVTVVVSARGYRPAVEQVGITGHGARQDFVLEPKGGERFAGVGASSRG